MGYFEINGSDFDLSICTDEKAVWERMKRNQPERKVALKNTCTFL